MRHHLAAVLSAILVLLAAAAAYPQEGIPIVVAGEIVARVRDKGPYDSLGQRAAEINKRITETISRKEAGVPRMSLKQENDLWTIYCGSTMLVRVYPAEAKANNVAEHELAARWLKNFERALPKAEPMLHRINRLGPRAFEKPVGPQGTNPTGGGHTSPPSATRPDPVEPEPGGTGPAVGPTAPSGRSAALLVVLNYFNIVRGLDAGTFEAQKDELGQNLITYLAPFVTAAREPGGIGVGVPPGAITTTAAPGQGPVLVKPAEPFKPIGEPTTPTTGVTRTTVKPVPGPGQATSRVPQKERIRRKWTALRQPLTDMKAAGDRRGPQLEELLSAVRKNYYAGEFDTAEELVDAGLELAGVQAE